MISLIHPSRGRPDKCYQTGGDWLHNIAATKWEYIISLDSNDPKLNEYQDFAKGSNCWVTINDNNSVVEATNAAAKESHGNILLYLSDDFKCFPNWGEVIEEQFFGVSEPMLLKVDDCLQKFDVPVLTIPIMNRALYNKLGYFWHPGYKSMFCDEDLYWTVKNMGALKLAPQIKFEHCHVSVGKAQDDETYRRSAKNWDQGKAFFRQRKAQGFPL